MKLKSLFFAAAMSACAAVVSCGGAESYKTPLVYPSDVSQSACMSEEELENTEESYEVLVSGKDIIVPAMARMVSSWFRVIPKASPAKSTSSKTRTTCLTAR